MFWQSSRKTYDQYGGLDAEARVRATQILQDELAGQTTNGGESNLLTGLRQLRLDHDEVFSVQLSFTVCSQPFRCGIFWQQRKREAMP